MSLVLAPTAAGGRGQAAFCPMIVGKALLNSPPTRQLSDGQQALSSFLNRKRERYLARRQKKHETLNNNTSGDVSFEDEPSTTAREYWSTTASSVHVSKMEERDPHQDRCVLRLASLSLHSPSAQHLTNHRRANPQLIVHASTHSPTKTNLDDLITLDCEELAEKVVSRARVRLRHCKKRRASINEPCKPVVRQPNTNKRTDTIRCSTPVSSHSTSSTPFSRSPIKTEGVSTRAIASSLNLNRSFEETLSNPSVSRLKVAKRIVLFSEKQSDTCRETGVPNVPPTTPNASEYVCM